MGNQLLYRHRRVKADLIQYLVVQSQFLKQSLLLAKSELKLSEFEREVETASINEDQTLHAAASILRSQMHALKMSNETYPTPSEISLSYSTQHTPCLLTKFLLWLIDDQSYNGDGADKVQKVLAILFRYKADEL